MENLQLLFYSSAEGCKTKKFDGNLSLKQLISWIDDRIIKPEDHEEYSPDFDTTIKSKVVDVNGHKIFRAVFEQGLTIELVKWGPSYRFLIEGYHKDWFDKLVEIHIDK